MVSLIASRGRQQWCDCLRGYSVSTRKSAPFRPFLPLSAVLSPSRCSFVSSFRAFSPHIFLPSAALAPARAYKCHYAASVWEGGRQTFKSTPPQSNYRPGHETRCPCIIYVSCRVSRHWEDISHVGPWWASGGERGSM